MKIRTDFVTNSSSSNFCCWKVESYDYIKISTHLKQFNGIYKSGNFELSAETDEDSLVFTRFVKGKELKLSNNEILDFYNLSEVLEYFDKTFKNNFDYSSCENNYDLYREKIYFDWDRKYVINDINIIFETAICAGFSNIDEMTMQAVL